MVMDRDDTLRGTARNRTLADEAFDLIEDLIVARELAPGAMLSENDLIERLSIGRTPVREALARLEWYGFVEIHPRRGVLVSGVDVLRHLELLEVRLPLERSIVRHVIKRATPEDVQQIQSIARELSEAAVAQDRSGYFQAKRALHQAEVRASYNPVLSRTMRVLHAQSRRFWLLYETEDCFEEAAGHHCRVVHHTVERDPERAVQAVEELFAFLEQLSKSFLDHRRPFFRGAGSPPDTSDATEPE